MKPVASLLLVIVALTAACRPAAMSEPVEYEHRELAAPPPREVDPVPRILPTATPVPAPTATPVLTTEVMPMLQPTAISPEARTGGRRADFPNTIIVYQRKDPSRDGQQKWTIYFTGRIVAGDGTEWQVPAAQVKELFSLVESPEFWEMSDSYGAADVCRDCTVETITVFRGESIKEVTIVDSSFSLPEELRQVLDELHRVTVG